MEMTKVKSSNVEAYGYDEAQRVLTVDFKSGSRYRYFDVPAEVAQELGKAESKGRFIRASVVGAGFKHDGGRPIAEAKAAEGV